MEGQIEGHFLNPSSAAAEEIKHCGVEPFILGRKEREHLVAESVAYTKLRDVRGELVAPGTVVVGDSELREQSQRVASGAGGAEIVAAEERSLAGLDLEGEGHVRLYGGPVGGLRGGRHYSAVVATHKNRVAWRQRVAETKHGEVVVRVVVVRPRFSGQAHAGEGAKLRGDVELHPDVEIDESSGDAQSFHFQTLEHHSLTALSLIERGVIVRNGTAGAETATAVVRELLGRMARVHVDVIGTVSLVVGPLILLHGAEHQDESVLHQRESLASLPTGEQGVGVHLVLALREDAYKVEGLIGVATLTRGGDRGLGLRSELRILVLIDAVGIQTLVESDWIV